MVVPPVAFRREIDKNLSDFFGLTVRSRFVAPSPDFAATITSSSRESNGTSTSITARLRARPTKMAASTSFIPRTGNDAASIKVSGSGFRPSIMKWGTSCSGPMPSARPTRSSAGWCWGCAHRHAAPPKPPGVASLLPSQDCRLGARLRHADGAISYRRRDVGVRAASALRSVRSEDVRPRDCAAADAMSFDVVT